jgi:hypothetical protein
MNKKSEKIREKSKYAKSLEKNSFFKKKMQLSNFQDGLLFLLEKYKVATHEDEVKNKLIMSQLTESEMKHKTLRELYVDKLMHDNLLLTMSTDTRNEKMVQQLVKNKFVIDHVIQRREQLGEVVTMNTQVKIIYEKCQTANKLLREELLYWVRDKSDQVRKCLTVDDESLVEFFCKQCNTGSLEGFHNLVCILECIMIFRIGTQSA